MYIVQNLYCLEYVFLYWNIYVLFHGQNKVLSLPLSWQFSLFASVMQRQTWSDCQGITRTPLVSLTVHWVSVLCNKR